ncbi:hypothetical protein ABW21_db0207190 [Orbilia brochopaga]|nr:hypothetical protein ABW21_db0207190 [Drechslerella brochopaga]
MAKRQDTPRPSFDRVQHFFFVLVIIPETLRLVLNVYHFNCHFSDPSGRVNQKTLQLIQQLISRILNANLRSRSPARQMGFSAAGCCSKGKKEDTRTPPTQPHPSRQNVASTGLEYPQYRLPRRTSLSCRWSHSFY